MSENYINSEKSENYCGEKHRNYAILSALRECAWFDNPVTAKKIGIEAKKQEDVLYPEETPSMLTIERTLDGADSQKVKGYLREMETFLDPQAHMDGYDHLGLTLFQVFCTQDEAKQDKVQPIDLEKNKRPANTRPLRFCLGYRFSPRTLGLRDPGRFQKTDHCAQERVKRFANFQHQISARWQFLLDGILDMPQLDARDAKCLHGVLKRTCTLGEIYEHDLSVKDHESIDFFALSKLTEDLRSSQKQAAANNGIRCLKITLGEYISDEEGNLVLAEGRGMFAYPIETRFFRGHYYVAVMDAEGKGDSAEYLRVDRIKKCSHTDAYLPRKWDELRERLCSIEEFFDGNIYKRFSVSACPAATLHDFIDIFGKNSMKEFKKTAEGWEFTIAIPASREKLLKAVHDEKYIREFKSYDEEKSTAIPHLNWEALPENLREYIYGDPKDPALGMYRKLWPEFDCEDFSEPAKALVTAIENRDLNQIWHLLAQWKQKEEKLAPLEAAWCCYLAMRLDAEIYCELLKICPEANTFASRLSATAPSRAGFHLNLASVAAFYDNVDVLKLLTDFGVSANAARDGDAPALHVAIRENSVKCLKYLLECPKVDKTITDELLQVFAFATKGADGVGEGYRIAAKELLGCTVEKDGFSPFPKAMTLDHILKAQNLSLLLQYCGEHPDSVDASYAEKIMDIFQYPAAEKHPAGFVNTMATIAEACPAILSTSRCRYLLAVAGLQKGKLPENLPALLKRFCDPHIVMADYAYHNWFGKEGMIHRWERLNHPAIGRVSPLLPAIDRNTPPPCDPKAISTEVMDIILDKFKIQGKIPRGSLSVLARCALRFASKEPLENALRPGGFLAEEDPDALRAYVENLRDAASVDAYQRNMLADLIKER